MTGGPGSDTFLASNGNDILYADDGESDAQLHGGPGADTAYYEASLDTGTGRGRDPDQQLVASHGHELHTDQRLSRNARHRHRLRLHRRDVGHLRRGKRVLRRRFEIARSAPRCPPGRRPARSRSRHRAGPARARAPSRCHSHRPRSRASHRPAVQRERSSPSPAPPSQARRRSPSAGQARPTSSTRIARSAPRCLPRRRPARSRSRRRAGPARARNPSRSRSRRRTRASTARRQRQ